MKQWRTWYRPGSMRRQWMLWLVLLHLGAAIGAGWFSYAGYGRMVHAFMDDQMRLLASSYAGNGGGTPVLQPVTEENVRKWGSFVVQVWHPDGRPLASSMPQLAVPLQSLPGMHDVRTGPRRIDTWHVYTAAPPAAQPGAPRVQIVQSGAFRLHEVKHRALMAMLPILLMLPVLLFFLGCVAWSTTRTLRAVADEIAAQDERSLTEISPQRLPEEIAPLVVAFNHLLARLRNAFATQRRFVQDAAHELRTPMAAIGLQMENFRACVPPGELTERFTQVEAGVRRAQRLIAQLLRLSRQDAPEPALPAVPVDLTALLRESVEQLMVIADRRRIDVGFDGRIAPVVQASPAELRSVFDNLIDNALRHAPEGGVVDVRLHEVDGHPVVDVVDDGPGIPPELRERVFDRFFRVPGGAAEGSGLGLAIAQSAALRHGLRIELCARRDGPGLVARVHLAR